MNVGEIYEKDKNLFFFNNCKIFNDLDINIKQELTKKCDSDLCSLCLSDKKSCITCRYDNYTINETNSIKYCTEIVEEREEEEEQREEETTKEEESAAYSVKRGQSILYNTYRS